jgi:hypothetical protein
MSCFFLQVDTVPEKEQVKDCLHQTPVSERGERRSFGTPLQMEESFAREQSRVSG